MKVSRGERVIVETPAQQRANSNAGSVVNNHFVIDARGADSAGLARVDAQIRTLNGSIEKRAISSVNQAAAEGKMPGIKK
jgi:hypothetical protein